jgi:hypothetical protein
LSHVSESISADAVDQDNTDDTTSSATTPSPVDLDTTDDTTLSAINVDTTDDTALSAVDLDTTDDTALPSVDQDTTNDTAVPGQTCRKCHKLKAPAEFISDKTGRPTVKCRMCLAPNPQTMRDSPGKRKVPASRKAAENTKIHEQLEGMSVSNRAKSGGRKAAQQSSVAAREMIQKQFSGATK